MSEQINYRGILFVILLIIILAWVIDLAELKDFVANSGFWAPILFILLKVATIVIAPISGSPLYPLGGLLFGFKIGLIYVAIGDFLGYTAAFFIGRYFGQKAVEKMISKNESGILARLISRVSLPLGFFKACLVSFPLPELLAYSAGLSRLKYRYFILILCPASVLVSSLLVLLGQVFGSENDSTFISLTVPFIGLIFIVGALVFFIRDIKKA